MKIIDIFLRCEHEPKPSVLMQAATEEGRRWLHAIQEGIRVGEAILIEAETTIEAVFARIPETLETVTM